jgi:serine/threonine-protein kinase
VFDAGTDKGRPYFVMEYVPGMHLTEYCDHHRLNLETRLTLFHDVCDAVQHAHSKGIIHRDLKPSNIIRNERGGVVLTDFGIVKALTGPLTKTQTGLVLGTPAYLSPEQARGNPSLSSASDIYALGVILFELLTGQVPFNDTRPMEVLLGHIQQSPPSPRSLRPDLPLGVEQVVLKALAKDPAARYATAGALAQTLRTVWPARMGQTIHSQRTTVNPTPSVVSRPSVPVVGRTLIASSFSTPPAQTLRPVGQRYLRTGFGFMTLPALLIMIVALFFIDLPEGGLLDNTPTTTPKSSQLARVGGLATTTPAPTLTDAPAPTLTDAPAPTLTDAPAPTLTNMPAPTLTNMPAPTLTNTPASTFVSPISTTVPPPPPPQAPQPTTVPPPPPQAPQPTVEVPDF